MIEQAFDREELERYIVAARDILGAPGLQDAARRASVLVPGAPGPDG